jgi:transglutaminase-like putative cysteine protease
MYKKLIFLVLLALSLLTGCGKDKHTATSETIPPDPYIDSTIMDETAIQQEAEALQSTLTPAQPTFLRPEASNTLTHSNDVAIIDYSNMDEGYVMIKYTGSTDSRLKSQVQGPITTYTYNITQNEWAVFPLSDGNGDYQFKVFENISGTKYALVLSTGATVTLNNEFAPFLYPNQYVNYENADLTIATAASLTQEHTQLLSKVEAVYNYVVRNVSYDTEKAATVQSGYLPDLDEVLSTKKGICFDYAALMTGMLRSQGIPCKLIFGYAGTTYHAWISVWSEETGWVDGAVFFNGTSWQRMDPTFAATGNNSGSASQFVGDGINYTEKYIY